MNTAMLQAERPDERSAALKKRRFKIGIGNGVLTKLWSLASQ